MQGTTERLRVSSDGSLGIGLTNPNSELHLSKLGASDEPTIKISSENSSIFLRTAGSSGSFPTGGVGNDGELVYIGGNFRLGTGTASKNLIFFNGSGYTERMRINTSGKVNIGGDYTQTTRQLGVVSSAEQVATFEYNGADTDGSEVRFYHNSASPADDDTLAQLQFSGKNSADEVTMYSSISAKSIDVTNGTEDGNIIFSTRAAGTFAERVQIKSGGNVEILDGNLIIGTSGHGIDFSATSDSSGSNSSELFDDYEEGTFTASLANVSAPNFEAQGGTYTKIGRVVHGTITIGVASGLDTSDGSAFQISSLPFTGTGESCVVTLGRYTNLLGSKSGSFRNVRFTGTGIILCEGSNSTIDYNECSSSGYLQLSYTYHTS